MTQVAQQQNPLGAQVALTSSEGGFAVTPQTLSDIVEFAKFMSFSNAGIPIYLRGNAPDCAAITMQALKWGFDPFSVAQKSYKVKDVLAYEAQLIAAVINARSGIKGRLKYRFEGEGDDLTCTVTGILDGEECEYTSPRAGNITTKNSPLWKTDPQQQLGYYSARNWARRHCPEVILGAYDRDEAEEFRGPDNAKDVTPKEPPVMARLRAQSATQQPQDEQEGFSRAFVADQTSEPLTGEIIDNTEPDDAASSSAQSSAADELPSSSATEGGGAAVSPSGAPSPSSNLTAEDRRDLMECCAKLMFIAVDPDLATPNSKRGVLETSKNAWKAKLRPELHDHLKSFFLSADAVIKGEADRAAAISEFAFLLECAPEEIGG